MPELIVQALALTIHYLKVFGWERIICLGALFRPFSSTYEMKLSTNTLYQLEILKNNSDGRAEGSLLHASNHSSTAFGSRLLKQWFIGVIHAILICGKQLGKLHVEDDSKNGASERYVVKSALLKRLDINSFIIYYNFSCCKAPVLIK